MSNRHLITKDEINAISHALTLAETKIKQLDLLLALEQSSHAQTIERDNATIARLRAALEMASCTRGRTCPAPDGRRESWCMRCSALYGSER